MVKNKSRSSSRYRYRYSGRSYRPGTSYAGKSLYTFAQALAKPAAKTAVKYIKKSLGLNTECKYLDLAEAVGTATSTTMTQTAGVMTPIPQGDNTNSRQGNSVRLTSMYSTFTFRAHSSSVASSRVRLVCVYQPKLNTAGAILANTDLFTDTTVNIETPYSMNTVGYKILMDKTFEISSVGQSGSTKTIRYHYQPLSHHIEWTDADTTGVAANLLQGYIRYFVCTDNGTHPPTYSSYTRIKWVDN